MATYYVAPHGDDANAGTAPGAPFRTINKAAQVMADGDVCYVAPGVYRESVTVPSPSSGTKVLTFVGDPEARKFPGVVAGPVILDGSDDGATSVRSVGVTVDSNAGMRWSKINVARFSSTGFDIKSYQTQDHVFEDCAIDNCPTGISLGVGGSGIVMRRVKVGNANQAVAMVNTTTAVAEDCFLQNVTNGFGYQNNISAARIALSRVLHIGIGSGVTVLGNPRLFAEDVAVVNTAMLYTGGYPNCGVFLRRVTVVNYGSNAVYIYGSTSSVGSFAAFDSLFAEGANGINILHPSAIAVANRCAFLDVATPTVNVDHEKDRWATTTDGGDNVILPDFTPVGAQLLRAEEENPIEGLRSARIDVPRVAYYPFKVAVAGGNTITLKARKSHPTGTTVKFRVDKDPNKVVTLADTDEVQTIQLGPVEDRGPRFVELEFWAQQVDYIPGHYVLIDSIQVL